MLGALSLALCLLTPRRITKYVPGSLLALVGGTLIASTANLSEWIVLQGDYPLPDSFEIYRHILDVESSNFVYLHLYHLVNH